MTNRFMVSVAALALIAGTGIANAQGMNKESGGASGGANMQHSTGANPSSESSKSGTTTGQAKSESSEKGGMKSSQSEQKSQGAMKNERAEDNVKGGSTSQRAEDRNKGAEKNQRAEEHNKGAEKNQRAEERNKGSQTTTGQAAGGANTRENMKSEGREGRTGSEMNREGRTGNEMNRSNERSQTEMNRSNERTETTGQAGAGAKLSTEQRTKISSVIKSQHVQSVDHVDFALSVGTRVPRERVHVQTLPSEVVSIYPQWRGFDYIVVHDKIVIIDPNTYEIVEVIES
jgi:hypothetical protein